MTRSGDALRVCFVAFVLSCCTFTSHVHAQAPVSRTTVDEDVDDEDSSLPWRGTTFTFAQSMNLNTLSHSAQLSYDPTYAWAFIIEPRWYFNRATYANIDQRLSLELTDSDSTLHRQRALLSDTALGVDTKFYTLPLPKLGELVLRAGAHVIAPTSLASQAATMVLGTRGRAGAQLTFQHVLHGASISLQGRYTHRFLRHNTVEAVDPYPCLAGGTTATNCAFLDTGTNVRDAASTILAGSLALSERVVLELLVWVSWSRGSNLASASLTTDSGYVVSLPDNSLTHWHNDRYLVLGIDWNVTDWLSLGGSVINYFSERNPDGSLRSPGKPVDLLVGLSTSIAFDQLYLAASGRSARRPIVE
jgi:hypothetical protein